MANYIDEQPTQTTQIRESSSNAFASLERRPVLVSLRGELSRWLLEPKAGVFVGQVSAMVREKLWELVCKGVKGGACMMVWSTNSEQGFKIASWGDTSRHILDWEGLQLVTKPQLK